MAEQTEKILLQLTLDVDQITANLVKTKDAAALLKKQIEETQRQMDALATEGKEGSVEFENLQKELVGYQTQLKVANIDQANYSKQLVLVTQANKANEGSYEQLLRMQQLAQIELKNLEGSIQRNADGTIELTDVNKDAVARVEALKNAILEFDAKIKDGRTNVGNYKSAIDAAFKDFKTSSDRVADLKLQIKTLQETISQGGGDQQQFNQRLQELAEELKVGTEQTAEFGKKLDDLKALTAAGGDGFKSLREQVKQARDEATIAQQQFDKGLISEHELIKSQENVSKLTKELKDFNDRVNALTPGQGFRAFAQGAASIAGGLSAAQGAMALFGGESEAVGQALLKVQGALALTTGLKELSQLGDSFKNIQVVLGLTTAAKKVDTTVQVANTIATEAGAVATGSLAVAEEGAAVSAGVLKTAINTMLGPVGLIILGIGAAVAALALFSSSAHGEGIEKTTFKINEQKKAIDNETIAIKEQNEERIAQAEIELALAKSQGKSSQEIINLEKALSQAKRQSLNDDISITEKKIALAQQQLEANQKVLNQQLLSATPSTIHGPDFSTLFAPSEKTIRESKEKVQQANEEVLKLQADLNKKLNVETVKHDADDLLLEQKRVEDQKRISEQATLLRISLIKNQREKEVDQEIESNSQKIRQLEKSEIDSTELIIAEKATSAQRIKEINLKFDQQELSERTQIEINSTVENTESRIAVEKSAAIRIRDLKLTDDKLTRSERIIIEQETQNQLSVLESKRISIVQQRNAEELKLIQSKKDAEIAIEAASVQPGDFNAGFQAKLSALNNELLKEQEVINSNREKETIANDLFVSEQLTKLQTSGDFKQLTVQQQSNEILEIINTGERKEKQIIEASDSEKIAAAKRTTQALVLASGERFTDIAETERFKLETKKLQLEQELEQVRGNADQELLLRKQIAENERDLSINATAGRLALLRRELEEGIGLSEKEFAEYELLLQKKQEAVSKSEAKIRETKELSADQQLEIQQTLESAAVEFFNGLVNLARDSAREQQQAQLDSIQTSLDAQLKSLDIAQAKEEGTFVERTATEKKFDEAREKARDRAEEETRKIKIRGAIEEKDVAIFGSIVNTALAVTNALATVHPYPAAVVAAISAGAAGAVQTALIAAKPIPQFAEGGMALHEIHKHYHPKDIQTFQYGGNIPEPSVGLIGEKGPEYVSPNWMVTHPALAPIFQKLETIRTTKVIPFADGGQTTTTNDFENFIVRKELRIAKFNIENENTDKKSSEYSEKKEQLTKIISAITNEYFTRVIKSINISESESLLFGKIISDVTSKTEAVDLKTSLENLKNFSENIIKSYSSDENNTSNEQTEVFTKVKNISEVMSGMISRSETGDVKNVLSEIVSSVKKSNTYSDENFKAIRNLNIPHDDKSKLISRLYQTNTSEDSFDYIFGKFQQEVNRVVSANQSVTNSEVTKNISAIFEKSVSNIFSSVNREATENYVSSVSDKEFNKYDSIYRNFSTFTEKLSGLSEKIISSTHIENLTGEKISVSEKSISPIIQTVKSFQNVPALSLQDGGYTGEGHPSEVSHTPATTYLKHKSEYVVPSFVLGTKAGAGMVGALENIRQQMKGRFVLPQTGYAFGGFTPPADVVTNANTVFNVNNDSLIAEIQTLKQYISDLKIYTVAQDISEVNARGAIGKGRANII